MKILKEFVATLTSDVNFSSKIKDVALNCSKLGGYANSSKYNDCVVTQLRKLRSELLNLRSKCSQNIKTRDNCTKKMNGYLIKIDNYANKYQTKSQELKLRGK